MESKPLELGLLRSFSPLDGLKSENLHALARKTALHSLSQGRQLFKEGDSDKRTYYVVSGVLELLHEGRSVLVIRGGSPEARNPVARQSAATPLASSRSAWSTSPSTATRST